jgi:hypothetical protein
MNSVDDAGSSSSSSSATELPTLDLSPIFPYVQVGKELQDLRKDVFKLYQDLAIESNAGARLSGFSFSSLGKSKEEGAPRNLVRRSIENARLVRQSPPHVYRSELYEMIHFMFC